jgi:hypothetical protein
MYSAEISRTNPACIIFLIDQSGSMKKPFFGGDARTKAEGVATALNRLLQTLVLRCARGDGIRDFFKVAVIGFHDVAHNALHLGRDRAELIPISQIGNNPKRIEERLKKVDDGAGGIIEQMSRFPIWVEPSARGKTSMVSALIEAERLVRDFVLAHPDCFPPIVVTISDGAATDGDPEPPAASLRGIAGNDGPALLFNAHLTSDPSPPILYPNAVGRLPDPHSRRLFRMSSPLPPAFVNTARQVGVSAEPGSRGFVFNADLVSVIQFLDIGTRIDPRKNP